ncbi:hypothetical protein [Sphingobacterium sp. MYb382]|uniref:hypothetical protein n=1 Tax=Sphingobacterium sp. MYb382 TaxID=2745278 RepID=UPI00309BCCF9
MKLLKNIFLWQGTLVLLAFSSCLSEQTTEQESYEPSPVSESDKVRYNLDDAAAMEFGRLDSLDADTTMVSKDSL